MNFYGAWNARMCLSSNVDFTQPVHYSWFSQILERNLRILKIDASGQGLVSVLFQEQDSGVKAFIAYASHTLQKYDNNYGVTELEVLGVVWTVKHFCHYLYGHQC